MLDSVEALQRKCEYLKLTDLEQQEINAIQYQFQQTFKSLGNNIEAKSELYGTFVHKMCKMCIRIRHVLHGSRFLRAED